MNTRLRYANAEGTTLEEMRKNLLNSEQGRQLYEQGDTILVWVNQGDLYNLAFFASMNEDTDSN